MNMWKITARQWQPPKPITLADLPEDVEAICSDNRHRILLYRRGDAAFVPGAYTGMPAILVPGKASEHSIITIMDPLPALPKTLDLAPVGWVFETNHGLMFRRPDYPLVGMRVIVKRSILCGTDGVDSIGSLDKVTIHATPNLFAELVEMEVYEETQQC